MLSWFRCCCCKKKPVQTRSPAASRNHATYIVDVPRSHVHSPTMVSFDLETTTGVKRAFNALPDDSSSDEKKKGLPPRGS